MWLNIVFVILLSGAFIGGLRVIRTGSKTAWLVAFARDFDQFCQNADMWHYHGHHRHLVRNECRHHCDFCWNGRSRHDDFPDALGIVFTVQCWFSYTSNSNIEFMGASGPLSCSRHPHVVDPSTQFTHFFVGTGWFFTIFIALKCLNTALHPLAGTPWFTDVLKTTGVIFSYPSVQV